MIRVPATQGSPPQTPGVDSIPEPRPVNSWLTVGAAVVEVIAKSLQPKIAPAKGGPSGLLEFPVDLVRGEEKRGQSR